LAKKKRGTLRIKDRDFTVRDATLSGSVHKKRPVEWYLSVRTDKAEVGGELWEPYAYLEQYTTKDASSIDELTERPFVIENGKRFCGNTILPGGPLCCLYVFEHEYLDENRIELRRAKGNQLDMRWTAKCAVHFDKKYGAGLELEIACLVDFLGFTIEAENRDAAARLLAAKELALPGFRFQARKKGQGPFLLPIAGKW
jgi:hypothetical protein